jgi:L-threonylcarbamoyladenylate synthase
MAARVVPATPENIGRAGALLRAGRLVAFPTETVYGLGCDATDDRAVAAVFAAKGRPEFNPLIVHVLGRDEAAALAAFDARADALAASFWPGPLTLVLPRTATCPVSLLATAGLDTIAIRAPSHLVARAVIEAAGRPIAAPSANRSGEVSPTTAAHVAESLGAEVAMILDGGPCPVGLESTVLDLAGDRPAILRPGAVTEEEIAARIGKLAPPGAAVRAPGMLARHYATRLPLRLDARELRPGEALLAFGRHAPRGAAAEMNLSPTGDLVEAAANLFAMMRALDRPGFSAIAVMPIPEQGLGRAINDRLRRAAAR